MGKTIENVKVSVDAVMKRVGDTLSGEAKDLADKIIKDASKDLEKLVSKKMTQADYDKLLYRRAAALEKLAKGAAFAARKEWCDLVIKAADELRRIITA